MRIAVVLLAFALVLTGCSADTPAPAGPTYEEALGVARIQLETAWSAPGESPNRATFAEPQLVSPEDWPRMMNACATEQGSGGIFEFTSNGVITRFPGGPINDQAMQDIGFRCNSQVAIDPRLRGMFSAAQQAYIWDYFDSWLVPCLELHGNRVGVMPSRDDYVTEPGWHPTVALIVADSEGDPAERSTEWRRLNADCPPFPAGLAGAPTLQDYYGLEIPE